MDQETGIRSPDAILSRTPVHFRGGRPGAGVANLGGALAVSLINGFVPQLGDAFEFLIASGGVNGTFAAQTLPALGAGLGWNIDYDANAVTLEVAAAPSFSEADFDEDLVKWRAGFGVSSMATHMQGDADADADVDEADFLTWQRQLGSTAPAVSASTTVPEPATSILVIVAAVGVCRIGGRMRQELVSA
jgi:hypothetical protein